MIICILQRGAVGMLLYLNSQEEQIISEHLSHTDHRQLKPEQTAGIFLGMLPGSVCQWGTGSVLVLAKIIWFTQTPLVCWERILLNHTQTYTTDRVALFVFLSKLHKTGAKVTSAFTFLTVQKCIFVYDWNLSFPWHLETDSSQR